MKAWGNTIIPFGKHRGKTITAIEAIQPDYFKRAILIDGLWWKYPELMKSIRLRLGIRRPTYIELRNKKE